MELKAAAFIFSLLAIAGAQADVGGDQVADVLWKRFAQLSSDAKGVVDQLQQSEISQQLHTLFQDNLQTVSTYAGDLQKQLITFATDLQARLTENSRRLKEQVHQEMEQLRAQVSPFVDNVRQHVSRNIQEVQTGLARVLSGRDAVRAEPEQAAGAENGGDEAETGASR